MPENNTVVEIKKYFEDLRTKFKNLNIEVTDWNVAVKGTDVGTVVEASMKLVLKKKK